MLSYPAFSAFGQDFEWDQKADFEILGKKDRRITVPFELVNNLILIEARINNSIPLKFIVDTGAGKTLVTSLPKDAEVELNSSRTVVLAGLGEGDPIEAFYSSGNTVAIESVLGKNVEVLFLKEDIFNLSSFMGTNVHGIIGYDLFADFAVEINYLSKEILLYDTEAFEDKFRSLPRHRKWHKLPIEIQSLKPYINVGYKHKEGAEFAQLRLLIDSGSSNAFSLYDITHDSIHIPKKRLNTLIGVGLSGNVNGYLGKVEEMELGDFTFEEPVIAYPDSFAIRRTLALGDRNGSLGGDILRRFKVIFHYEGGYLLMRRNRDYRDSFEYNRSGVEVNTPVPNIPLYVVSNVRDGSPAEKEGLKPGDIIRRLGGKPTAQMNLNDVLNYLQKNKRSRMNIEVQRDSENIYFQFKLTHKLAVDE